MIYCICDLMVPLKSASARLSSNDQVVVHICNSFRDSFSVLVGRCCQSPVTVPVGRWPRLWLLQVILYCGALTGSIRRALDETTRRRKLQVRRRRPASAPVLPLAPSPRSQVLHSASPLQHPPNPQCHSPALAAAALPHSHHRQPQLRVTSHPPTRPPAGAARYIVAAVAASGAAQRGSWSGTDATRGPDWRQSHPGPDCGPSGR
jgi:hypothetical protein